MDELEYLRKKRRLQELEQIMQRGGYGIPGSLPSREQMKAVGEIALDDARNAMMRRDPKVDTSGVSDFGLRAALSRADNDQERAQVLDNAVGAGNWTTDDYGRLALKRPNQKPLLIDDPYNPFELGDLADMAGDAPAIAGGMLAAPLTSGGSLLAAGGGNLLRSIATSALGSAGGKGLGESYESLAGENLQDAPEVAKDVGFEGLSGAVGEAGARSIAALGRKLRAPYNTDILGNPGKGALKDERVQLGKEVEAIGGVPKVSRVVDAPMTSRFEGMFDLLFGDPNAEVNARALLAERDRLINAQSPDRASYVDVGNATQNEISSQRQQMLTETGQLFADAETLIGEGAVVPTAKLKSAAAKLLSENPTEIREVPGSIVDASGQPLTYTEEAGRVLASPKDRIGFLKDIAALPDEIPIQQWQTLTTDIRKRNKSVDITQSLDDRYASTLKAAAVDGLDDGIKRASLTGNSDLAKGLRDYQSARDTYRDRIGQFQTSLVKKITKNKDLAGSLYPEQITQLLLDQPLTPTKEIMSILPEQKKQQVRRLTMERLLDRMATIKDDPTMPVFDPSGISKAIKEMSEGANEGKLSVIFGDETISDLKRLERVTKFTTAKKKMSGALVAANIALHPLKNLGKLARLRALAYMMTSNKGRKYLTVGLGAPNTSKGRFALYQLASMSAAIGDRETRRQTMSE